MTAAIEAGLYRVFRFNSCVAMHELRLRTRGWRLFIVLLMYASVASAAVLITLIPLTLEGGTLGGGALETGRVTFAVLAHTQLTLILLILPAYAAGAITMEREKRTLEMLRATLVTPFDVVTGKLAVILAVGLVLLLTSLPVASWCILLGGIAPEEVFYTYSYLFAVAAFASALGMMCSARGKRSMGAVVGAYGALIAIGVLSMIVPWILMFPAMSGSGSGSWTFGPEGAFAIVLVLALISGWIIFLLMRAVGHRLPGKSRGKLFSLLGVLLGLVVVTVLTHPWGGLYQAVEKAHLAWIMALNPYVGLSAIMDGMVAQLIAHGPGAGGPSGVTGMQPVMWAIITGLFLFLAVALWSTAVRSFARRRE
ncbi:MAG TPA: hypothetical protein VMY87_01405 [Armatimonadota bacterium]|nr:hypothetical protein [Armatimonadota bacterium]